MVTNITKVNGETTSFEEQEAVKHEEELRGRLVDRAHHRAARGGNTTNNTHHLHIVIQSTTARRGVSECSASAVEWSGE